MACLNTRNVEYNGYGVVESACTTTGYSCNMWLATRIERGRKYNFSSLNGGG